MASSTTDPSASPVPVTMPSNVVPKTITITDNADVTLRVIEYTHALKADDDGHDKVKAITDFHVNRQVMTRDSEPLRTLLTTSQFAESGKSVVDLKEHESATMQVIICALHSQYEDWVSSPYADAITESTLKLPAKGLWDVIKCSSHFLIEHRYLDAWFCLWYEKNSAYTPKETLLFPCYQLRHAEGFAAATEHVVYNSVRIHETRIKEHPDLHLPHRVFQQLCAARGRLKTILANKIWCSVGDLIMNADCSCKEKTVFKYLHSLITCKGFPVDQVTTNTSIQEVLDNLGSFEDVFELPGPENCHSCAIGWVSIVNDARRFVDLYFDGLCLDCMDHTKPKFEDEDEDYWNHLDDDLQWDKHCRIAHGQATWYFSFMGRVDTRNRLLKRVRLANPSAKIF